MNKKAQYIILFIIIGLANLAYFVSSSTIICSNDGSHFALVKSMVEKRRLRIDGYVKYTRKKDYAERDGHYYSDRVPGTAIIAIPFYLFGKVLKEAHLEKLAKNHKKLEEITVVFLPNLSATIALLVFFLLCRLLEFDPRTSLTATTVFAFSTPNWLEASHLFSHSLSMVTTLSSVYLIVLYNRSTKNKSLLLYASFCLAVSSIVEIQNVLFVCAILVYLFLTEKINLRNLVRAVQNRTFYISIVIFITVYSILFIYNYNAFGVITIKSNTFNPRFPEESSFFTSLSGDFLQGLKQLFFTSSDLRIVYNWGDAVRNKSPGLFIMSPVFLLSAWGWVTFYKRFRNEAIFLFLLILPNILIAAFHKTTLVRHIFTITPYIFLPVAFIIEMAFIKRDNITLSFFTRYKWLVIIIALFLIGTARVYYVIHTYYNRSLSDSFPLRNELPLYFAFYSPILITSVIVAFIVKRRRVLRQEKPTI